ncbi:MAG: zinc-binding dehydrogenase [Cyanobacteria bacterium P01_H01_bin.153]
MSIYFVFTPQHQEKLNALKQLIEREKLRPVIDSVMPWYQVAQAHQYLETGGTRSKVILNFIGR